MATDAGAILEYSTAVRHEHIIRKSSRSTSRLPSIPNHHLLDNPCNGHDSIVMEDSHLDKLEEAARSPRRLALLRIESLDKKKENNNGNTTTSDDDQGLAAEIVAMLQKAMDSWLPISLTPTTTKRSGSDGSVRHAKETILLRRILTLHLTMTQADSILGEELGRHGSHRQLLRLLKMNCDDNTTTEDDQDAIQELQDTACEIGTYDASFPQKVRPFSKSELRDRLPLLFQVESSVPATTTTSTTSTLTVLIPQVTSRQSEQADVGFVLWPSSVVLARWIAKHPNILLGKSVLELGSGCGLVGLTASLVRKQQQPESHSSSSDNTTTSTDTLQRPVIMTDFNKTVLDNLKRSIALNHLSKDATVVGLDFTHQTGSSNHSTTWVDTDGTLREQVDVVLAADIVCQPDDAYSAANSLHDALKPGGLAIVVLPETAQRFGVDQFLPACRGRRLHTKTTSIAIDENGNRSDSDGRVDDDLEQTSGCVEGMSLTMFTMKKSEQ